MDKEPNLSWPILLLNQVLMHLIDKIEHSHVAKLILIY